MNTKEKGILAIAIATAFLIAAVGSASAQNHITNCTVINSAGLWIIDDDIVNSTAGKCIDIQSDNVILDGQWHYIDGITPSTASKYGVYSMENSNVTIRNVEVMNFREGIRVGGEWNVEDEECIANAEDITIENCTVHDNGDSDRKYHGIHFKPCVYNSVINNCTVYNQIGEKDQTCEDGGAGIRLHTYCDYNDITDNTVYNNALAGIYSKMICQHCYVFNNTVYANGEDVNDNHGYFGGGIRLECKKTNFWTVENNTVTDNWGPGIHVRGKNATVRYNVESGSKNATNNRGDGSDTGVGDGFFTCGTNQKLVLNSFCDNEGEDIYVGTGGDTTGDSDDNTCDTTKDYNDAGTTGCTYSCFTVDGYCFYDGSTPDVITVDISNLNTDKKWQASTEGNYYSLLLRGERDVTADPDVRPNDELRVKACDNISSYEHACNVTDHEVTSGEIIAGGITKNLTLNHYCLNYYPDYPFRTWEQENWSGPAVMEMLIDHYLDPPDVPSQTVLNDTGIANNDPVHAGLLYVDPEGMETTLDSYLHPIGRNYAIGTMDNVEDALHRICYWQKLGPGTVPAYEDYSNWMAVRGIHTSKKPTDYSPPYEYDVHGFWINDPNPSGIGENSYKTATEFTDDYYKKTIDPPVDKWNDTYITVLEPPEYDADVTIVPARARFARAIKPVMIEKTLKVDDIERVVLVEAVRDKDSLKVVKAAIDGVTEALIPYDAEFAAVFAKTVAGEPLMVTDDGGDYYLVPFNVPIEKRPVPIKMPVEIEKVYGKSVKHIRFSDGKAIIVPIPIEPVRIDEKRTLVVVAIDAEDGSFKEASWIADPVKYLPVSDTEALKLVFEQMKETKAETKPIIELVYRDSSPYYPYWKITVGGKVFFVSQDGTVTYDKQGPVATPVLPPKPVKPSPKLMPI